MSKGKAKKAKKSMEGWQTLVAQETNDKYNNFYPFYTWSILIKHSPIYIIFIL